ncbi:MAG: type I methionyl aminopeptidase [bacterium]|nr:type I methionyl aminopeptidase [bacterium]MDT8395902.1 type I methionyl aminopeptidase [bacterium]
MIHRKSVAEIAVIQEGGRCVAKVLERMRQVVKPGITTMDIEREADRISRELGIVPAFRGYNGYPACICVSVNEEVVHGIPSEDKILAEGDIVGLDFGALHKGFYSDAAVTLTVGRVDEETQRLLDVTREALDRGIAQARQGNRIGDISSAVQNYVEDNGFSVVKVFVGHGIGRSLHEEPQIPNYGEPQWGVRLKPGMTLAIEPMVNAGTDDVKVLADGWTAVTTDGKLSAHFEHTVAVTENGPLIVTVDN